MGGFSRQEDYRENPRFRGAGCGVKAFDLKDELFVYLNGGLENIPGILSSN